MLTGLSVTASEPFGWQEKVSESPLCKKSASTRCDPRCNYCDDTNYGTFVFSPLLQGAQTLWYTTWWSCGLGPIRCSAYCAAAAHSLQQSECRNGNKCAAIYAAHKDKLLSKNVERVWWGKLWCVNRVRSLTCTADLGLWPQHSHAAGLPPLQASPSVPHHVGAKDCCHLPPAVFHQPGL